MTKDEKKQILEVPEFDGGNVPIAEVARIMKKDPQFVRQGIIQGFLPIGVAYKKEGCSQYSYYVSPLDLWLVTGYCKPRSEKKDEANFNY